MIDRVLRPHTTADRHILQFCKIEFPFVDSWVTGIIIAGQFHRTVRVFADDKVFVYTVLQIIDMMLTVQSQVHIVRFNLDDVFFINVIKLLVAMRHKEPLIRIFRGELVAGNTILCRRIDIGINGFGCLLRIVKGVAILSMAQIGLPVICRHILPESRFVNFYPVSIGIIRYLLEAAVVLYGIGFVTVFSFGDKHIIFSTGNHRLCKSKCHLCIARLIIGICTESVVAPASPMIQMIVFPIISSCNHIISTIL